MNIFWSDRACADERESGVPEDHDARDDSKTSAVADNFREIDGRCLQKWELELEKIIWDKGKHEEEHANIDGALDEFGIDTGFVENEEEGGERERAADPYFISIPEFHYRKG